MLAFYYKTCTQTTDSNIRHFTFPNEFCAVKQTPKTSNTPVPAAVGSLHGISRGPHGVLRAHYLTGR